MERQLTKPHKDKIEITKQQVLEIQQILDSTLHPQKNHTLFDVDLNSETITEAIFDEQPLLHWNDAVSGNYRKMRKITRKENHLYISALNVKNVKKILKRDYNITIKFTYENN